MAKFLARRFKKILTLFFEDFSDDNVSSSLGTTASP